MSSTFFLYKAAEAYQELSQFHKLAYIKKMPNGKYRVFSRKGKNLGTYSSRKAAKKRLQQVEYFKHLDKIKKSASKELNLNKIEDFSYSSIMRKINQQLDKEACKEFAQIYKDIFDKLILEKEKNVEEKSLAETVKQFSEKYSIKLDKKIKKDAAAVNLGDASLVGKYLANVIKFTLGKISAEKRPGSIHKVKSKISKLDINEIANKKMPASSSMGQSITFIKHILFGQSPQYIKSVMQYVMRYL